MTEQTLPTGPAAGPSEQDIAVDLAAKQAAAQQQAADTGTAAPLTGADIPALIAVMQQQMAAMQAQIDAYAQQAGPLGDHPLLGTAKNLRMHLADVEGSDVHRPAIGLADDLVEAAGNAVESGDLTHVKAIAAKLERFFRRQGPRPGDDHHGRAAREIIAFHLPDVVDAFVPRPKQPGIGSSQLPVKVTSGSVVAG